MENEKQSSKPDEEITVEEVLENLEFGLWTAVVLIPVLYYVNGPSVSTDQWCMRAALCAIAYLGAPLTTFVRRKKRARSSVIKTSFATENKSGGTFSSE